MNFQRKTRKWCSIVLSICILCSLIVIPVQAHETKFGTISVEKFTLGQGYLKEPQKVLLEEGDTVASVTARFLGEEAYKADGSIKSSFYLTGIADESTDEVQIPSYILQNIGINEEEIGARNTEGWLSQYDYTRFGGWLFSVNGVFSASSASDVKINAGDVIRWQFSVAGYGADLGNQFGESSWIEGTNKDSLTAKIAQINADQSILSDSAVQESYDRAINILCDMQSAQEEVDTVLSELTSLVPDDVTPGPNQDDTSPGKPVLEPEVSLQEAIDTAASYLTGAVPSPSVGTVGGEWLVIGLARSGIEISDEYFDTYYENLKNALKETDGVLDKTKYTEYSRAILALAAIGKSPVNVGGYHLLEKLTDFEAVCKQGVNGPIYALLALDAKEYPIPASTVENPTTREKLVDYILEKQLPDGGFDLADTMADPDLTAMAIQALSKYQDRQDVKQAIDRAIECLCSLQTEEGGYASWGVENVESAAQVLIALCALGIDPEKDSRFWSANGAWILSYLMQNRTSDGAFLHTVGGGADQMATEQVFYALVAYDRMKKGKNSLYNMTDVKISSDGAGTLDPNTGQEPTESPTPKPTSSPQTEVTPTPTPTASATPTPTKKPDKDTPNIKNSFVDLDGHWAKDEINTLYQMHVVNGVSDTEFEPNRNMTRAEFAAVITKALGLDMSQVQEAVFDDVEKTDWFYEYVNTAVEHGLIQGNGSGVFLPNEPITREETAVIIMRAAKIKQLTENDWDTELLLAPFSDAKLCAPWSRDALAFNVEKKFFVGSDGMLRPTDDVTRAEQCVIIFRFLNAL